MKLTKKILIVVLVAGCGSASSSGPGGGGTGGGAGTGGASGGSTGGSTGQAGATGGSGGYGGSAGATAGSSGGAGTGGSGGAGVGGRGGAGASGSGGGAGTGGSGGGAGTGGSGGSAGAGGSGGASAGGRGGAAGAGGSGGGAGTSSGGTAGTSSGGAGGTGGAPAHSFAYGPSVTSRTSGTLDVFAPGADGLVYQKTLGVGGWGTWTPIVTTGNIVSDVDAAAWSASRIDLFGLGTDGDVYQGYMVGTWSAWYDLSPATPFKGSPAVAAPAENRLWLLATGSDDAMWGRYFNGSAWTAWASLGGGLLGGPDVTARPARTWAAAQGTDGAIWINTTTGTTWSGFTRLPTLAGGNAFSSAPCITNWSDTRVDVFARGGSAQSLWHTWSDDNGANWGTWENLGGILTSAPDCVAWGAGRIDIVVRNTANGISHNHWQNSWSGWADLGVY